jgi:predicted permease
MPKWITALVRRVAPAHRADDVLGDLEEAHLRRVRRRGMMLASALTLVEALDMTVALLIARIRRRETKPRFSWLDFKLGFRMLVRFPALTVVGGLAIAFAIAVGAGVFEIVNRVIYPKLPLEDSDRIVGVRLWNTATNNEEDQALYDFGVWREQLQSIEDLSAIRRFGRNLITENGTIERVMVAETSASIFRVARVSSILGRVLVESDEKVGAPAVAVIDYEVWQSTFKADRGVLGRTIRLGNAPHTVIGVMPEGFAFPLAQVWTPLRVRGLDHGRRSGPEIRIFGRLADGNSLAQAQAELSALGLRASAEFPDTHEHLRPRVMTASKAISLFSESDIPPMALHVFNVCALLLLVLVCSNVAMLMFARAAARVSEIVVRNALGASRGRIIVQLFSEALVLGGFGAAIGLASTRYAMRWGVSALGVDGRSVQFDPSLSPATLLYAALLTLLVAVIAGVVPALKVTRGLATRLREAGAGGPVFRFGGLWGAILIIQVAVTVAFPVLSFFVRRDAVRLRSFPVPFPAEQYLSVQLEMDREALSSSPAEGSPDEFGARFDARYRELERRLMAESGVVAVTFAEQLPRMYHPYVHIELDDGAAAPPQSTARYGVRNASVDVGFHAVFGAPILSGRGFHSGDLASDHRVVIVNQSFVDRVLGGGNPIGRRLRYLDSSDPTEPTSPGVEHGPWHEIVGVVEDLGMNRSDPGYSGAGFYHPIAPSTASPVLLALHLRGDPESFVPHFRSLAPTVDLSLRLSRFVRLDKVHESDVRQMAFWFQLAALVSFIALLLSLTGIYSILSYSVSRRTREIGIRLALGSSMRRILMAIFMRPLAQIALGVLAGGLLTGALSFAIMGETRDTIWPRGVLLVFAYAALMMGVCLLSCVVPTWRALRIAPTEAMRSNG